MQRRIAIGLSADLLEYIESQRARLHSVSDSELIRDLLHEHRRLVERVAHLERKIRSRKSRCLLPFIVVGCHLLLGG